ncbi:hypothetical protein CJD35_19150 (plasmid) [Sphingobium xenophagum]|jgi:hypothetical protein|uniref:Uncharacterized protein n=1 Tax=Sphingobium xenophagum TaxID=121428 RepID=A0A249MYZ5_SPHXE|nr:hypothetical protein [Sphingobium xenophagum]ASY46593.1 hypothetical protein CJD35_19150 [Sphingobium xenophagum]
MFPFPFPRSAKRDLLCSRQNAERVAARLFAAGGEPISVVRIGDLLQPYRVALVPARYEQVETVMVS